jgi:hypothetical protein
MAFSTAGYEMEQDKTADAFSAYHPLINFIYFGGVIVLGMFLFIPRTSPLSWRFRPLIALSSRAGKRPELWLRSALFLY